MKGIVMTRAQAEAHQRKHGFLKGGDVQFNHHQTTSNAAPTFKPKARRMNNTELDYAFILESMKRKGEILRYEFEGITLRWAGMRYTPDFTVIWTPFGPQCLKFIEVKGGHIWSRDMVRFKGARAYWPEFQFELWQKKQGQWNQIL